MTDLGAGGNAVDQGALRNGAPWASVSAAERNLTTPYQSLPQTNWRDAIMYCSGEQFKLYMG